MRKGSPAPELETPCLLVERRVLLRNLQRVQARANEQGAVLRPHLKTHKCIDLGRLQLAAGAVGLTAAKPSEAQVFIESGAGSLTLAAPVVDPRKLDRLLAAAASHGCELRFIADSAHGAALLAEAAGRHGRELPVFLKVDVGLGRVGVDPRSAAALDLAQLIGEAPALRFAGLLSHAGHAYAAGGPEGVRATARAERELLAELAARLEGAGLAVPEVSVGCTPTMLLDDGAGPAVVTEHRPGNYAFLDLTAVRLGAATLADLALGVLVTVISRNRRYAIIDAGSKTLSSDLGPHGMGKAHGYGLAVDPQLFLGNAPPAGALEALIAEGRLLEVERLSEEHGFVRLTGPAPEVGSQLVVFPNHACVVANLATAYHVVEDGAWIERWSVHARACVQ